MKCINETVTIELKNGTLLLFPHCVNPYIFPFHLLVGLYAILVMDQCR
jgi:hypothetical protein